MVHLTVAVARFMEILLWEIGRVAGALLLAGLAGIAGLTMLVRAIRQRRRG